MSICDNSGNILAPLTVRPVNQHDSVLFTESFFALLETAEFLNLDLFDSYLTLDSGFDSDANLTTIRGQGLTPVIKPVNRAKQSPESFALRLQNFQQHEHIYLHRSTIERTFAWEDVYRKLVIRYETLQSTHMGFKYLAYSMVNLRWFVGKK